MGFNRKEEKEEKQEKLALPTNIQGLGLGLPDLKSKKRGKQKVPNSNPKDAHVSETLDKLKQQTREAVKNMESISGPKAGEDLGKDAMMEEWVKQFEELAGSQVVYLYILLSYGLCPNKLLSEF